MLNTTTNQKNVLFILLMFIFLIGCEETTPTSTTAVSQEESKCASIQAENKLPEPNLPENYIGKNFDSLKLPNGLEFVFGSLIGDTNFALTQVITSENNAHLLWLSEIKCGQDYIQDILVLPVLRDNEELVIRYCRVNGQEDPEILAIGEFTSGTIPLTTIEYVWRANRETKKFEVLPLDDIECWRDIGINSP